MCPARCLVLGIDAANPDLLRAWMADGTLPNLARLAARGVTGPVRSVAGFFVGSTWPSFQTGLSPAEHGVHYLAQLRPGSYAYHNPLEGAETGAGRPFWRILSRAGKRVAVLDVPLSRLEPELNGIQTVEWGSHDAVFGFRATPPALAAEVTARFGSHPPGPVCDGTRTTATDWRRFTDGLTEGARIKGELTRTLHAREPWDLFIQVFTEAHCAGHQAWHLHDPTHPAHDPQLAALVGDPIREVCIAIDAAIGTVLHEAGEARVLVVSLHGMAAYYGAPFLLQDLLFQVGAATPPPVPAPPQDLRGRLRAAASGGWHQLPLAVRNRLRPLRRRLFPDPPPGPWTIGVEPASSRCFAVGNGAPVGGIRLNIVGREPQGLLTPGAEVDQFIASLTGNLLDFVDTRTGKPAIRAVRRTDSLYGGPALDLLPDLLVEWSDALPTGSMAVANGRDATLRFTSPRLGTVEGRNWYGRTGDHRPGGIYLAAGPGVPAGASGREVAVTEFAALLGMACQDAPAPWPLID